MPLGSRVMGVTGAYGKVGRPMTGGSSNPVFTKRSVSAASRKAKRKAQRQARRRSR